MKAIYGECVCGIVHAPVTISRLARDECEFVLAAADAPLIGDLSLWIGAIGPLAITTQPAQQRGDRRQKARFAQPLEQAILAHFAA